MMADGLHYDPLSPATRMAIHDTRTTFRKEARRKGPKPENQKRKIKLAKASRKRNRK